MTEVRRKISAAERRRRIVGVIQAWHKGDGHWKGSIFPNLLIARAGGGGGGSKIKHKRRGVKNILNTMWVTSSSANGVLKGVSFGGDPLLAGVKVT